jgi:hypothetical protein
MKTESAPILVNLETLVAMDRASLANCWEEVFDCPAPRHSQVTFLCSALAWHCQMRELSKAGSGDVNRLIRSVRRQAAFASPALTLAPGTRLLREWKGRTHHVTVLDSGFEYEGKVFKSLTAITRTITGMGWSGPLFFGLRK